MPAMPGPASSTSEPRTLVSHPELASQRSFPTFRSLGEAPKGPLERALSIFADVRAGEGVGVLLLATNIFVILACYYLLRSARQGLILTEGAPFGWSGAQLAAYSSAGMALVLLGVVPLYGWLGSRVPRMTLMTITTIFFASNLVLFYLAGRAGIREAIAFYIWLGIFNMFIPSQFWGFANDLYTEGQGRRLFPLIGVGASLGAVLGAAAVGTLVRYLQFTPFSLMALAAPRAPRRARPDLSGESARDQPGRRAGCKGGQGGAGQRGRVRARLQGPVSDVDCGPRDPAQPRQLGLAITS